MAKPKSTSFVPSAQEGLLLRSPLTQAYTPPNYYSKSLMYSRNVRPDMLGYHSEILEDANAHNALSFYTRHNPHPVRVKHFQGLLGNPVCMVEDNLERRILWSAPSGEDLSVTYRPPGSTRYSANGSKHLAAVGIVPVTYAWRDELEKKTHNAISKALGQNPSSVHQASRPMTGKQRTNKLEFDSMEDDQLLNILCRILQTDSIPACQAWLQSATDNEKTIVLNMLRMAATGEINKLIQSQSSHQSRPNSAHSLYVWNPHQTEQPSDSQQDLYQSWKDPVQPGQEGPFKLPTHDTIIRSAHSRLSTRNGNEKPNFHDRLQNELDQVESRLQSRRSSRPSSAIHNRPMSAGLGSRRFHSGYRPRSRSSSSIDMKVPAPPIRVQVTGAI